MLSAVILLICLGSVAAFAAFNHGGMSDLHWRISITAIAAVGVVYAFLQRKSAAPDLEPRTRLLLVGLLAYVAFQAVPLPVETLEVLSPARAEATRALASADVHQNFASLSVTPALTVARLFTLAAYVLMFLLSREAGWKLRTNPWLATAPLIIIAVVEAVTGIYQHTAASVVTAAHGSYVNRNHFAGLLEVALPFAVLYPVYSAMQLTQPRKAKAASGALALLSVAAGTTILVGILFSLSRMGFAATLAALFLTAALLVSRAVTRYGRLVAITGIAIATVLAFVFLPPDQLIERFAQLASSEHFKSETRLQVWKETLRLVSDYLMFGCGAGGYESAFLKYQDMVPLTAVEYAHNDYLQWLAELGIFGFLLAAAIVTTFVRSCITGWRSHPTPAGRMVALGCFASSTAFLIHSVVDFQTFIPANALAITWIAGVASSLTIQWDPLPISDLFGTPRTITVSLSAAR